ncbi:MAG: hypothetical protein B7Z20_00245 [Sphingobium sp. 32-64-5]|nr:MAG: hypothetical protein B7Z43_03820 [Sphingomonas sp. 12-62-6]OYW89311.1 MAG: hypothetical protein B7Z20_00245 [Sphingobium sp. 32-64-5]
MPDHVPAEPIILVATDPFDRAKADAATYAGRTERGGILLGSRRGRHLHIEAATLPSRWDKATMFAFHRGTAGHQAAALRRWKTSRSTSDWLGEWHSHPERSPTPSKIDLECWNHIVQHHGKPMVFVIFGYQDIWVGLLSPGRSSPARYRPVEVSGAGVAYVHATPRVTRTEDVARLI